MGWTFYDIKSLPDPGDIVWCKWPQRENRGQPGPTVRPTLIREARVNEDPDTGHQFGSLIVSYGTGEFEPHVHEEIDLVISDMAEARNLGLHKPTRFSLAPNDKKHLFWCEEYFVSQGYQRAQNVVIGRLGPKQVERMRACLVRRGLLPPS